MTADLRELRETMAARGGPAAALAHAIPDHLGAAALDALTPAIVRALRVTIYGGLQLESGERQGTRLDGGQGNASGTTLH